VRRLVLTLLAAVSLLLPAVAHASGRDVITDCEAHGELTGTYTKAELKSALKNLPTDLKEYSNCETLIEQAIAAASVKKAKGDSSGGAPAPAGGGGTGTGTGGGSGPNALSATAPGREPKRVVAPSAFAPPSAVEDKAVDKARFGQDDIARGALPVQPGGASSLARGFDGLPDSLRALVVLLAVAGLVAAGLAASAARSRRRLRGPGAPAA
jgi:hypothetical protein